MTADELLARLTADLRTAHAVRQSERPDDGLTASMLLGCSSAGARALLRQPGSEGSDIYRALRGIWTHDGINADLAVVDPGFEDGGKERFTWDPGGGLPVVTGAGDAVIDGVMIEWKSRPKAECRWHADHGADPQHAAQVSAKAATDGATQAFVVYLPTDAGIEEIAVCEVDIRHWLTEAVHWLHRIDVRDEVDRMERQGVSRQEAIQRAVDPIPREPQVQWCRMFCPWAGPCRGDYRPPEDVEIQDPVVRAAAVEAEHWRSVRLDAEKREKAAKSRLTHAEGTVHDDKGDPVRVRQSGTDATAGRRASKKVLVERRPE